MKTNSTVTLEHKNYLDMFLEPNFSAYDFLFLFSAIYIFQNENCFNRDHLISFIRLCKNESKFENLLNDINLKNNGISDYSEEFDEAIGKLKWGKVLYTISPEKDSTIYFFDDIPATDIISQKSDYFEETIRFIDEYKTFEDIITPKYYFASKKSKNISTISG